MKPTIIGEGFLKTHLKEYQENKISFGKFHDLLNDKALHTAKWVSTLERKPEYGKAVLIALRNGMVLMAYRSLTQTNPTETTWFIYNDNLRNEDIEITHWCELPHHPNHK